MKKMKLFSGLCVFLLVFGLYGMAFGGSGGPEDPGSCPAGTPEDPLPAPDAGKFLRGEFTVARVYGMIWDTTYSAHFNLKKGNS